MLLTPFRVVPHSLAEWNRWIREQKGTVSDYLLEVAKGNVPRSAIWYKFGRNIDIDTGTAPEDVWNGGGDYTGFPTGSAETLEIASSSINDTAAGTGARTVKITNLLDGDGNEMDDVTVTLNGTSYVSLGSQTYNRCSRMLVMTAGSSGHNEGALTLRHTTTTTNIFAVMPALVNQTAICCYTVPKGKTLYVNHACFTLARTSGAAGSATVSLRARKPGETFQSKLLPTITDAHAFVYENNWLVFTENTDIKLRVDDVSDNNTMISGELDGILYTN